MNNTRPSSASKTPNECQNCSNWLVGTCESHAEKKITSNWVSWAHENTSATSKLTFADRTRSRAISTASGAASIAVTVSASPASASVHKPVPHAISNTRPAARYAHEPPQHRRTPLRRTRPPGDGSNQPDQPEPCRSPPRHHHTGQSQELEQVARPLTAVVATQVPRASPAQNSQHGPVQARSGTASTAARLVSHDGAMTGDEKRQQMDKPQPALPAAGEPVRFEQHIKPLFRPYDRQAMSFAFDLWSYDDVSQHAEAILGQLQAGTMPCAGAWPQEKIDVFSRWADAGKPT